MQGHVLATEQRKSPRFASTGSQNCFIQFDGKEGTGFLCNLSRQGLSFQYGGALEAGQNYRLKLKNDWQQEIVCEAKIIWSASEDQNHIKTYGAKILIMDPAEKIDMLDCLYRAWKHQVNSK